MIAGPGAITIRAPSWFSAWDMNGSGMWAASTWPFASAVRIAGKGITTSLIEFGSTPSLSSAPLITTSPTPLSALTAIVLPARSCGVRIELDPLTMTFCQLSATIVPSTSLAAAVDDVDSRRVGDERGRPADVADVAVVVRRAASTMSLPLWSVTFLISMPVLLEEALADPEIEREAVRDRKRVDRDGRQRPLRCAGRRADEHDQRGEHAAEHARPLASGPRRRALSTWHL